MSYIDLDRIKLDPIAEYKRLQRKAHFANQRFQRSGGHKALEAVQRANGEMWAYHCNAVRQGYVDEFGNPTGKQQPRGAANA